MKDREKKDEELNTLFRAFVAERQSPPPSVSQKAKLLMGGKVAETAKEEIFSHAAGGEGVFRGRTAKRQLGYSLAAALLALLSATLFLLYAIRQPSLSLIGSTPLERSALTERTTEYSEKDFLPFIEKNSVTCYTEFSLKEDADRYHANDVVAYYLEYRTEGVSLFLYVESKGVYLTETNDYKQARALHKYDKISFRVDTDSKQTFALCYFTHDRYGYNLGILSADKEKIEEILKTINELF